MSGKISGKVWDLDLPHAEMLVLLAMADHADHEGNNVYPSIGLIAWKTGYSERQVMRIQQKLRDEGLLVAVRERQGFVTVYRINTNAGKPKPEYAPLTKRHPRQNVTGDKVTDEGSQNVRGTPDIAMSDETSVKPSIKRQGKRATADAADAPAEQSDDYRQPTAPEQPSPIADKLHSRQVAPHQSIIDAYAAELGYKLRSGGKEAGAAKWLANNEYTPEQVVSCYRSLKSDPWWTDKHLSLQTIANQIGAWITKGASSRRNGHGPKPVPAQPRYAEPDVKPRATLKDLEKQR